MALKYPKSRLGKSASLMAGVIALIGAWEGVRTVAYPDIIGVPTVCFGETRGVKMGDKYTIAECKEMLGDAVIEFEMGMRKCLKNPDSIPPKTYTAFLSTTYNIGVGAFCGSSMARKLNAGDYSGACASILLWNKAGGRVVKGLVNRRKEENQICIAGLKAA